MKDLTFEKDRSALLIIDMQNGFIYHSNTKE